MVAMPSNVCSGAKRGQRKNGKVGEKRQCERKDGRRVFLHQRSRTIEGSTVVEGLWRRKRGGGRCHVLLLS
jgi:hypothetical protein